MGCAQSSQSHTIADRFTTLEQVMTELRVKGLESCNLIVGIDCTKSNTWSGLHDMTRGTPTPYEKVLSTVARTLADFDDDNQIPMFGFGDSYTTNKAVFSFKPPPNIYCHGLDEMLTWYRRIIPQLQLLGPTSLVPLIYQSMAIVRATGQYHILVAVTDGAIDDIDATRAAIVEASRLPLSIVCVGVGNGPWGTMMEFDDGLPERDFDNFQFVEFNRTANNDTAFAVAALQEIPEQYRTIKRRGLLELEPTAGSDTQTGLLVQLPPHIYGTAAYATAPPLNY